MGNNPQSKDRRAFHLVATPNPSKCYWAGIFLNRLAISVIHTSTAVAQCLPLQLMRACLCGIGFTV